MRTRLRLAVDTDTFSSLALALLLYTLQPRSHQIIGNCKHEFWYDYNNDRDLHDSTRKFFTFFLYTFYTKFQFFRHFLFDAS